MAVTTQGRHLILEFYGCNATLLRDQPVIEALMERAALATGAAVVGKVFHVNDVGGVCGVVVISESHLSIHTWPEREYAAVDFYTCGTCDPEKAVDVVKEGLEAQTVEVLRLTRGMGTLPCDGPAVDRPIGEP